MYLIRWKNDNTVMRVGREGYQWTSLLDDAYLAESPEKAMSEALDRSKHWNGYIETQYIHPLNVR